MDVSLKWLSEYVDVVLPPEELAHRLTMSGTEVTAVRRIGAGWEHIFVGRVRELRQHPNADRLLLATLDYGHGAITVVTGAWNMKVGDKVPVALVGARLIDGHYDDGREIVLKPTKLRGVVSEGMACSAKELGLSDEHEGILILDPEAQVGQPLAEELGDVILEVEPTPNRGDCLCVLGVAREVAALTGQCLRPPVVPDWPVADVFPLEILAPDLCSRYSASLIRGVRVGPSPKWMRERLESAGQRPINNIVDITNYVMLEMNQPLHAFDFDRLAGGRIVVRRARDAEMLLTLDGTWRPLSPDMLVIADAQQAVAVAGIMGGGASEVTEATTNILLESANFNPVSIRRTTQALHMTTEASRRFEKGLPAQGTAPALVRATQLMVELAGGHAEPAIADCYPVRTPRQRVRLEEKETHRLLGIGYSAARSAEILTALGFECTTEESAVVAAVPPHRPDVTQPADLVEEVARVAGYDEIPLTTLHGPMPEPAPPGEREWEEALRDVLVGCGLTEVITYSLTCRERMERLLPLAAPETDKLGREAAERLIPLDAQPVLLSNPLSVEMDCLRTTALASLLDALRANLRHLEQDLGLFEIGRIYLRRDDELPEERLVATIALGAYRSGRSWGEQESNDFGDLKGIVEAALSRLGVGDLRFQPAIHPTFEQGQTAVVTAGDNAQMVGILGGVNPLVCQRFDIEQPAWLAALDLSRLIPLASAARRFQPLPRYPAVVQDLAVVVDEAVPAADLEASIRRAGKGLVAGVELFDLYRGPQVPMGQKSLAYHIRYQAADRTLTDAEVARVHRRIVETLHRELGATLRGSPPAVATP